MVKCVDLATRLVRGDRLDHARSPRSGSEEGQQAVTDERGGLLGRLAVHIHPQHVEARLNQPLGGLPVEVRFSVAAVRREHEVEALVRPAGDVLALHAGGHRFVNVVTHLEYGDALREAVTGVLGGLE